MWEVIELLWVLANLVGLIISTCQNWDIHSTKFNLLSTSIYTLVIIGGCRKYPDDNIFGIVCLVVGIFGLLWTVYDLYKNDKKD